MISIIIPAYNEERRIEQTLKAIKQYMKKYKEYEIILVDDGSSDTTCELAAKHNVRVLKNKQNRGKGYSVKKGMLAAKYANALFTDADLSTPITELDKLLRANGEVIIGSRNCEGAERVKDQTTLRQITGRAYNILVRLILGLKIKDTQCGFKLFKNGSAKKIFKKQTIEGFSFDIEILHIANKSGYKISEVPVKWYDDRRSKVKLRDSIRMFLDLIKVKECNT